MVSLRGRLPHLFLALESAAAAKLLHCPIPNGLGDGSVKPDRVEVARYADSVNLLSISDMRQFPRLQNRGREVFVHEQVFDRHPAASFTVR